MLNFCIMVDLIPKHSPIYNIKYLVCIILLLGIALIVTSLSTLQLFFMLVNI